MADKTYVVKGLMAIVNLDNGMAVHMQRGGVLPSNVDPAHLQHLLDQDLVVEGGPVGGLAPTTQADVDARFATKPAKASAKAADPEPAA